jgi:hypothetical protein
VVTGVYASATNATTFTAAWSNLAGATGYGLDVSTSSQFGVSSYASDLFISEYIEGASNEKYIEIYNGTGVDVGLTNYALILFANGATAPTTSNVLSGTLTNGGVVIFKHTSATNPLGTVNSAVNFNGDDTMALWKRSTAAWVDIFGRIGEDPGSAWTSGSFSTLDKTLIRKSSVTGGVTTNPGSGFPTLTNEWDQLNISVESNLNAHAFAGGSVPDFVAGYSNRNVSGLSASVTGLMESVTYYFRVRATNDDCATLNSTTASVLTVAGPAPEIAVVGTNLALIAAGDLIPTPADGTDFGAVLADGAAAYTNVYSITNSGTAALAISGVSTVSTMGAGADFVVASWPTAVEAGTRSNLTVIFNPAATGVRTAVVTVASSDADESSYSFALQGTGVAPEVAVSGMGVDITDGDAVPSGADGTDFGAVLLGIAATNTFTVTNSGSATLTISGVTTAGAQAAEFVVVTAPAGTLAPGASTTFQLRFEPASSGARTAAVTVVSDDADEALFDFAVQGLGQATAPEIAVLGTNFAEIADGTAVPAAAEGTDFGAAAVGGGPVDRTLYITNSGNGDLAVSGVSTSGAQAADFVVLDFPGIVSPGTASNLLLRFAPLLAGTRSATVIVNNNDGNEGAYDFALQGTGLSTAIVETAAVGTIGETTAQAGGDVTSDGGSSVTNRGVVYNTAGNPTLADSVVQTNAPGTGAYTSTLASLTPGRTYHVRAFAQNAQGTSYGGVSNFAALCFTSSVVNLHADPTNTTDFTAVWDARAGASGYAIDVSTNGSFGGPGGLVTHALQGFEVGDAWNYVQTTATISTVTSTSRTGTTSLRLESSGVATFSNIVLDASVAATVSVAFAATGVDSGEDLFLDLSYDAGTTWTQSVKLVDGFGNASLAFNETNDVDPTTVANPFDFALGSATQVRVRVRTAGLEAGEYYYVDDVSIRSATPVSGLLPGYSNRAVAATSIAVTGLASGVSYYYRVRATNDYCAGVDSTTATVTTATAPAPEIALLGTNGAVVADGDIVPALSDGTDFGSVVLATGYVDRVFVITNLGNATLNVSGVSTSGAHAADFLVMASPAGTVAPGSATSFTLRFEPSAFGGRTATVTVASDDAMRPPMILWFAATPSSPWAMRWSSRRSRG